MVHLPKIITYNQTVLSKGFCKIFFFQVANSKLPPKKGYISVQGKLFCVLIEWSLVLNQSQRLIIPVNLFVQNLHLTCSEYRKTGVQAYIFSFSFSMLQPYMRTINCAHLWSSSKRLCSHETWRKGVFCVKSPFV